MNKDCIAILAVIIILIVSLGYVVLISININMELRGLMMRYAKCEHDKEKDLLVHKYGDLVIVRKPIDTTVNCWHYDFDVQTI